MKVMQMLAKIISGKLTATKKSIRRNTFLPCMDILLLKGCFFQTTIFQQL
jgi:hypothetical protein